ncbi:DUF3017 domain-containing protein [Xylanimonas protaetiae]|uniref:DUF3017 domain-containing protein n=1 Tax=Xylanimonas protaetiae TaxID=2509457 RepID=A0A4P6F5Y7_9MICO|nr:DUF3017 domain-containing protein [Xylanimonas protaetiae]QAY70183.1 DUF3017 domain-containing protein [Xylanimonas protaetiae]
MDQRPLFPGPAVPPPGPTPGPTSSGPTSSRPTPPGYRGPSVKGGLVLAVVGVSAAAVLGTFVSARLGAVAVAVTLGVAGTWRAVAPRATHAAGIAVRSKTIDAFLYLATAAAILVLAVTVPYLG